jgi:hypothetical protein
VRVLRERIGAADRLARGWRVNRVSAKRVLHETDFGNGIVDNLRCLSI